MTSSGVPLLEERSELEFNNEPLGKERNKMEEQMREEKWSRIMQKSRRVVNRALSWRLRAFYLHPSWYAGDTVPSQQPLSVPVVFARVVLLRPFIKL